MSLPSITATPSARRSTRMVRLTVDVPSAIPIVDLHRFAREHECRIVRRADGSLVLRPAED